MSVSAHRWAKGSSWRAPNWQQNTNSFIQVSSTKDTHFKDDHFLHKGLSLNSNLVGCNSNYDESFTKFVYQFYLSLLYQGLQLPGPLQQCKAITTHLADKQSCEDALLLTCAGPDFQLLLPYSLTGSSQFSVIIHGVSYFQLTYSIQWGILNQHDLLPPSFWRVNFNLGKFTLNTCVCYDPMWTNSNPTSKGGNIQSLTKSVCGPSLVCICLFN